MSIGSEEVSRKTVNTFKKVKNTLTRRKESDTYLTTVSRHHWSPQMMKATVLAESYYISSIFIIIYGLQ
jgi:hypothetical protein